MADIPEKHNKELIEEASEIQESTKAALIRIQKQVSITEEIGQSTLEELEDQQHRRKKTLVEIQNVNAHAKKTDRLIGRFDLWAGNWGGLKKSDAKIEASETIAALQRDLKRSSIERERTKSTVGSDLIKKLSVRPKKKTITRKLPPPCQIKKDDGSPDVVPEELDEETKAGLERLERTDKEVIDSMLDEVSASLDRLNTMSTTMLEEIQSQNVESKVVERQLHKAVKRKIISNARIKNVLTGKWKNRNSG
jgi:hypothetical protein